MKSNSTWNDMLLKAHFESLNPKWNDQESVITLMSEVSRRLADPEPLSYGEREEFNRRIRMYLDKNVTRTAPKPMKSAGNKSGQESGRKTGT